MKAGIRAIEYYLPKAVLENEELAALYSNWTAEKILEKTGIASRHVADKEECVSDMAEKAAEQLLERNNIAAQDIDFLILVTENPDYILPHTSAILQARLGMGKTTGAIDVNLGCSGFVYGIKLAKALVISGEAKRVLLLTADAYSRRIHPMDKSTRTIFGDAAAATLIDASEESSEIGNVDIGTDGHGYGHLIIPAGGMRIPHSRETEQAVTDAAGCTRTDEHIYMNGQEIFSFSLRTVPLTVTEALKMNNLSLEEIDWFVFHQANRYMLEYLRKKMKLPEERFIVNMEDIGNTVSASIPIAMKRAADMGLFHVGEKILLCGFGVGLSWGTTIITFGGQL